MSAHMSTYEHIYERSYVLFFCSGTLPHDMQEGETVVVSGAAGAVGSLVGQIAKLKVLLALAWWDRLPR